MTATWPRSFEDVDRKEKEKGGGGGRGEREGLPFWRFKFHEHGRSEKLLQRSSRFFTKDNAHLFFFFFFKYPSLSTFNDVVKILRRNS